MKRITIGVFLLLTGLLFVQAQTAEAPAAGGDNPSELGNDSAQQDLKWISVDKFEFDGYWTPSISYDDGFISSRLFEGKPAQKEPIEEEADLNIPDDHVLGTRVDFLHRGHVTFFLHPSHPIPIEGITKELSIWAVGRNYNHELKILIQDSRGRPFELSFGKLNFQGWKQLSVTIPPQSYDAKNGIVQRDYHYNNKLGIKIIGFKVECDPSETVGTYYLYLDDLRAYTDLFAENNRDPDDIQDAW